LEAIYGSISKTDTLIFNNTFAFTENKKQEVLVGALNGLYKYSYATGSFKRYTHQLGKVYTLSDNEIRSFCIDNNGITWIGTNSGGLNRFDEETETFTSFTTNNGLPDNSVYSILKDEKGNLWLGTNNGICRFTIKDKTCRNYTIKDGIQNVEFNTNAACALTSGELVFGGVNGFNIIDPNTLNTYPDVHNIVITQFRVGEKEMPVQESYHLNYYENNFSFQFALLNFFRNDENNYAYKLEPLDEDWTYSKDRRFTNYSNLAPGKYTFRVKAANHFGEWSNEKAIIIIIKKPWYATWLFRIVSAILLFAIIYALFRYRVNNKMKMQEMRNRIASDLHDEIGSTLSSISLYSEVAHKIVKQKAPEANSMMAHISESTSNMMEALSDIVWTINTRNDKFNNVVNRMRAFAVNMLEAKGCNLQFEAGDELHSLQLNMEQRKNFYLVFKEAINNIAKYAEAKNVTIQLSAKNKMVRMKIVDDGKGFNPSIETPGNGLINMKKRALELKGELQVHAAPQKGTVIELHFGY
jgi:Y_Y_Y domain/Histidine kinase/Two component regulator propeller